MGSTFKTTNWNQVVNAPRDGAALEAFLERYWPPVYAYIRRTGRSPEDAADLTQSFFAAVVRDPRLLEQADPTRGRFRSYLLAATRNFLIDEKRRERRRNNHSPKHLPIDPAGLRSIEPHESDDPSAAFERQWATTVIEEALRRTEQRCHEAGMARQWTAFDERVLRPIRQGAAPPPYSELVAQIGASSEQEVYSMLQTMKRMLHRELLAAVRETLDNPDEAACELAELKHILAMHR